MPASTMRSDFPLHDAVRDTVEAAISARGGRVTWRDDARTGRTYGLIELPDDVPAVRAVVREPVTVFETPIIALALSPSVPEALPALQEALGGSGRPDGVISCTTVGDAVVVEWDPGRTPPRLLFAVVDAELRRFASGRTAELLVPLPESVLARIAADGLDAADVASGRVLETLLHSVGIA
jgi:hypothetical protein